MFSSYEAKSQDKDWGYLTFKGTVLFDDVGLGGAKVVLHKNGKKMGELITPNNGKFTFKAERDIFQLSPEDDKYIIQISKPGHVTIKYAVSTKVPADIKPLWPTCVFSVDLFKMPIDKVKQEEALMSILEKPISLFSYDPRKGEFNDDRAYFSTIQARVEQLFEILDADEAEQYKLIAAYRVKKIEEEKRRQAEAEAKSREGEVKLAEEAAKREEKENLAREAAARKAEEEKLANAKDDVSATLTTSSKTKDKKEASVIEGKKAEGLRSFKEAEEAKKAEQEKNKAIKTEREKEIIEALAEKERLEREKGEYINRHRKETGTNAVIEKIKIETRVKTESKPIFIADREKKIETEVNKNVKQQDAKRLITMVAEKEVARKRIEYTAATSATPGTGTTDSPVDHVQEDGKKYRPDIQDRSKQDIPGEHWVYKFSPEIVKTSEKGILKTVKTTVIIFPARHSTLKEVSYAWGKVYYYMNDVEIDEETYFNALQNTK